MDGWSCKNGSDPSCLKGCNATVVNVLHLRIARLFLVFLRGDVYHFPKVVKGCLRIYGFTPL